jgi:hypothetical protein
MRGSDREAQVRHIPRASWASTLQPRKVRLALQKAGRMTVAEALAMQAGQIERHGGAFGWRMLGHRCRHELCTSKHKLTDPVLCGSGLRDLRRSEDVVVRWDFAGMNPEACLLNQGDFQKTGLSSMPSRVSWISRSPGVQTQPVPDQLRQRPHYLSSLSSSFAWRAVSNTGKCLTARAGLNGSHNECMLT